MRPLLALVAALLAIEAALWSALAPLLARYGDEYALSQTAAGLLTAAYTAGVVVSACAALALLTSWEPRQAIVTGLLLLSASTVAFSLAPSTFALIAARIVQGLAAGQVWIGGISWLTRAGPVSRRGRHIGVAVGASNFGTVVGPAVGTVAVATNPGVVFTLVAVATAAFIPWALLLRGPTGSPDLPRLGLAAFRSRALLHSLWLVALPSLPLGLAVAVIPLRLSDLGLSHIAVGTTFLVASGFGSIVSLFSGYLADRHGRRPVIAVGLGGLCPTLLALGFATSPRILTVSVIVMIGGFYSLAVPAAVALISDHANLAGSALAAPALTLITITVGETVGSAGGAALSAILLGAPFTMLAIGALAGMVSLRSKRADGRNRSV